MASIYILTFDLINKTFKHDDNPVQPLGLNGYIGWDSIEPIWEAVGYASSQFHSLDAWTPTDEELSDERAELSHPPARPKLPPSPKPSLEEPAYVPEEPHTAQDEELIHSLR